MGGESCGLEVYKFFGKGGQYNNQKGTYQVKTSAKRRRGVFGGKKNVVFFNPSVENFVLTATASKERRTHFGGASPTTCLEDKVRVHKIAEPFWLAQEKEKSSKRRKSRPSLRREGVCAAEGKSPAKESTFREGEEEGWEGLSLLGEKGRRPLHL